MVPRNNTSNHTTTTTTTTNSNEKKRRELRPICSVQTEQDSNEDSKDSVAYYSLGGCTNNPTLSKRGEKPLLVFCFRM